MSDLQNAFAQYALFAWLLLLLLLLLAFYWLADARRRLGLLSRRYTGLTKGVDDLSLVAALDRHADEVQHLGARVDGLAEACAGLRGDMKLTLRRVGIIRYNPFGDTGGDQSFALALLDDQGDGVVLNSIFGRNESRVYAKPVKGGKSKYTLTAEEDQAIINASLLR
ncbi:MAG: DUF4446 family protein [Chloroflexi bacterium]|nr:DUF4446 family protein [Chloroflexota bacterium]